MQSKNVAPTSDPKKETGIQRGRDHVRIGRAANIPVPAATPVVAVSPVVLSVPGRLVDLQVKVSAPTTGRDLPLILLSHGGGTSNNLSSLHGYSPVVDFWAAHGFVVIQPTHLTSKSLGFDPTTPGAPLFWRSRIEDMNHILDHLMSLRRLFQKSRDGLIAVVWQLLDIHSAAKQQACCWARNLPMMMEQPCICPMPGSKRVCCSPPLALAAIISVQLPLNMPAFAQLALLR